MNIMEQLYLEEAPDLKEISESMGDAFVSLDSQWRFRLMNNKALGLMGKTREELIGRTIWEVFPEKLGTICEREFLKVMQERVHTSFETYYKPYSLWLEVRAYPQQGGICIFYTDVTEKKRLAAESMEILQRFQLYAKMNPAGIFHTDGHGNCLFANDKWQELTGISVQNSLGYGWMHAFHEEGSDITQGYPKNAMIAGKSVDYTFRYKNRRTGLTLQVHIMSTPVLDDGTISGYLGTLEDITEVIKAHEIVADSEKWFRNVANNAPVMICIIGLSKECSYRNNSWLEFTGRKRTNDINPNWIDDIFVDDRKRVTKMFNDFFDNRWDFRTECRVKHKGGNFHWVSVTGKPLYEPDGTFMGYICSCVDINEQVMVYQELENRVKERTLECTAALEREKEVHTLKSRFVSMASHEFRTPLTTILSSVELMDTYIAMNEPQHLHKHVDRIKNSVKHLRSVLDDFLSVEELEQGNVKNRKTIFDLRSYISETVDEVGNLLKKDQKIRSYFKGSHNVNTDKEIINHILFNLLSNAIKYSDKDVIVDTEVTKTTICMSIADEGIGIPEEEQQYLFNNYFRATNVGNIKGTGLGLSIVKRYVEVLGGTITFSSQQGRGTKFTLQLPKGMD